MSLLKKWFALIAVSLFIVGCSSSGDPEQTAVDFTKAAYSADIDALMKLVHFPDDMDAAQKDMVRGKLTMMLTPAAAIAKEQGGIDSIKAGDAQYNSDKTRASVPVTVTFNKASEESTESVDLIKVDGAWKVKF